MKLAAIRGDSAYFVAATSPKLMPAESSASGMISGMIGGNVLNA